MACPMLQIKIEILRKKNLYFLKKTNVNPKMLMMLLTLPLQLWEFSTETKTIPTCIKLMTLDQGVPTKEFIPGSLIEGKKFFASMKKKN